MRKHEKERQEDKVFNGSRAVDAPEKAAPGALGGLEDRGCNCSRAVDTPEEAAPIEKSEVLKLNAVEEAKAIGNNRRRKTTTGPVLKAAPQATHAVLAQGRRRKTTTGPPPEEVAPSVDDDLALKAIHGHVHLRAEQKKLHLQFCAGVLCIIWHPLF